MVALRPPTCPVGAGLAPSVTRELMWPPPDPAALLRLVCPDGGVHPVTYVDRQDQYETTQAPAVALRVVGVVKPVTVVEPVVADGTAASAPVALVPLYART